MIAKLSFPRLKKSFYICDMENMTESELCNKFVEVLLNSAQSEFLSWTTFEERDFSWSGVKLILSKNDDVITDETVLKKYKYYVECIMDNYSNIHETLNQT
jgi:hypothetical protein